ncbi:MAG: molybdenum cofactor guanylyltransferase [Pseudomonadota bacterium]
MSRQDFASLPNIACVVLAGGRSRRFGSNKAFAEIRGARLIDQLVQRLAAQTSGPIAINAPSDGGYARNEHTLISDRMSGDIGPLAGLHAALSWAEDEGMEMVITTPVDTPLLPSDYVRRLLDRGAPSVSQYQDRTHPLNAIWPTALRKQLEQFIQDGMRKAFKWSAACGAADCVFPEQPGPDPFFNINTQDDLQTLLNLSRSVEHPNF